MINKKPLVSIIIPTYNRAHLISETLDSVLAQTYQNWECIIVDDGSSDHTDEVVGAYVEKDTRFKYYHRPEEHLPGGNGARNYGFKMSRGEYIQWFDSDDLMVAELLFFQTKNLISRKVSLSVCLYDRYDEDFSSLKVRTENIKIKHSLYYDYILKLVSFNLPTILFTRECLKGYNLNEHLLKSQEYEFLQRILRDIQNDFSILNRSLVKVRRHKNSITGLMTDEKLNSLLMASHITLRELPAEVPNEIKRKLFFIHVQNLKIAYLKKSTKLFFKYLYNLSNIFLIHKFVYSSLYIIFYFSNRGQMLFNKFQRNM